MENLRQSLILLFLKANPNTLLKQYAEGGNDKAREEEEWFVHSFPNTMSVYTLSQKKNIYKLLKDKWMRQDSKRRDMMFFNGESVFNTLLNFTSKVLVMEGNEPVCQFPHLLRWHQTTTRLTEDLFTTAYFASMDLAKGTCRKSFNWAPYINHDDRFVNQLFQKPLTDLHFHLYGSSLNFDIIWLCLMNCKASDELLNDPIFCSVIKATALRLYIFLAIRGELDIKGEEYLKRIIISESLEEIIELSSLLPLMVSSQRHVSGIHFPYEMDGDENILDYAITVDSCQFNSEDETNIFAVLSGERYLLYNSFKLMLENKETYFFPLAFYTYLLYKNQIREQFIQFNAQTGFLNFQEFQDRKLKHLQSGIYKKIITQLACWSFYLPNVNRRYLEIRITPWFNNKVHKCYLQMNKQLNRISNDLRQETFSGKVNNICPRFIFHFLKRETDYNKYEDECRHYSLRKELMVYCEAIEKIKCLGDAGNILVGIDAAGSELDCRPEVFAQTYRYLRSSVQTADNSTQLHFTYHVGEDFYDIIDGLRAIDEAIRFLPLKNGDRIGHALALGTDVSTYYKNRNNTLDISKQALLDNAVWLMFHGSKCQHYTKCANEIEGLFERLLMEVYGKNPGELSPRAYYQSWLLRGDNPVEYMSKANITPSDESLLWKSYNKVPGAEYDMARKNPQAIELYSDYHYNEDVIRRGAEVDEIKISNDIVELIEYVQDEMLRDFERRNIAIECAPTSNIRIGENDKYINHPILKFYNDGIELPDKAHHEINVSINTDDKGVFATSIEREYSLLAAALKKDLDKGNSRNTPHKIINWLDQIREMGWQQRFCE